MVNNPVAKNTYKFNKPKVETSGRDKQKRGQVKHKQQRFNIAN